MGKPVEKHPCWACGFLKVSGSGSSMKCAHPDITQSESYKYGKPFTCRCTPKWCPKDPDKSYLGSKMHIPDAQMQEKEKEDRRLHKKASHVNVPEDCEMERVKNETENEMKNEQTLDNSITEQMQEKIAYASEQRKRLGSLVYRIDLSNRDKSLERTDEMIATENRISETLMNLLDVYDGIQ